MSAPRKGPPPPFLPAEYTSAEYTSIHAVANGTADAEQQKRAMKAILEKACDVHGLGWHPDSAHAASFVAGRRFAGLQIAKGINVNPAVFRKEEA